MYDVIKIVGIFIGYNEKNWKNAREMKFVFFFRPNSDAVSPL